ncbi:MAG: hypothetical protein GC206_02765 [Alphaproteobacteria bacterium]|nr:hypothetical protein [Alphaproteobacteria bacterium]
MSRPPQRPPLEGLAGETDDAASVLTRVLSAADAASGWLVDDAVYVTRTLDDGPASAIIEARSEETSAHIECEVHPSGWLCAEAFVGETMLIRVWAESAAEGIALWPDAADGAGPAPGLLTDDALMLACAAWPELNHASDLIIPRIGAEE